MNNKSNQGFTLLELSIALIIIGIVVFLLLTANKTLLGITEAQVESTKIRALEDVISNYQTNYKRLPCPARLDAVSSDSDYGYEAATTCDSLCSSGFTCAGNVILGAVPFKTLGVPENLAKDLQNSKVMYAMDRRLANKNCGIPSSVVVNDISGNLITSGIGHAIFSPGPNKSGAIDSNFNTLSPCPAGLDNANCNLSLNFVVSDYITSSTTQDFDDTLAFGTNKARKTCPDDFSGCQIWLDTSDICIYSTNPDTTVNSIQDKSTTLALFSQSNTLEQPQIQQTTLRNYNSYLQFTNGFLYSNSSNIDPNGDFTISIAFSPNSTLTQGLLFAFTNGITTSSPINYGIALNNTGSIIPTFIYPTNQQLHSTTTINNTNAHIITIVVSQSTNTATMYVDSTKSAQTTSLPSFVNSTSAITGNHSSYGQFTGNLYEIIVINRALPDLDRTALEIYLNNKWAIN